MNPAPPARPRSTPTAGTHKNQLAQKQTEGKAASSRNRLLHGLRANKHILLDEDSEEFLLLVHDHLDRFRPVGPAEENWSCASPTTNGAWTAPSPSKPASTATASTMSPQRKNSASSSTLRRKSTPKRTANRCRRRPRRPTRATSWPAPSTWIAKVPTPSSSSPATKAASSAPSTAASASWKSTRLRATPSPPARAANPARRRTNPETPKPPPKMPRHAPQRPQK